MEKIIKLIKSCTDFDELDLPKNIYKYRTWTDSQHKTLLSNQIVYMSSPSDFEDVKDCKSQKRYDLLTKDDIYIKYLNDSYKKHPKRTKCQHEKYATENFKNSSMHNIEHITKMQKEHLKDFSEHFGVLSLSANPINNKMWIKYCENHFGICVGFDTKKMSKYFFENGKIDTKSNYYCYGGGKVNYCKELPMILPNDIFEDEYNKQIFCKEEKWGFEDEYRMLMYFKNNSTTNRQIKLPKECFSEIIFGFNTSVENKKEIIKICNIQKLNVEFKQVVKINEGDVKITSFENY